MGYESCSESEQSEDPEPPKKKPKVTTAKSVKSEDDAVFQTLLEMGRVASDRDSNDEEEDPVASEVDKFISGKELDFSDDTLSWWNRHGEDYPRLAILAKEVVCVPATSAPSERVFSTSGLIVDKRRSSLHPAMVNILVFLHRNAQILSLSKDSAVIVQ